MTPGLFEISLSIPPQLEIPELGGVLFLFIWTMVVAIRTENTAISGFRTNLGATPSALVEHQSIILGDVQFFHKSTLGTG
jgi:hypothetical protein